MSFKLTKDLTYERCVIRMNGVPHIAFGRRRLIALQSWPGPHCYTIELQFKGAVTMRLEYDTADKWKASLELLSTEVTEITSTE